MKKLREVAIDNCPDSKIVREFNDDHADRILANQQSGFSPVCWEQVDKHQKTTDGYSLKQPVAGPIAQPTIDEAD